MPNTLLLLGREIPLYGLMFLVGIVLSATVAAFLARARGVSFFDLACSGVYVMFGGFLGAKLLFVAVTLPKMAELGIGWINLIFGGFVFYGGLLGGALALALYVRRYPEDRGVWDIYATALPLGHACGRVGCFFAGCCYGIPYDGILSHTYTASVGLTPLGVPLLPIQLIEAASLLLLFALQLWLFLRQGKARRGGNALTYLISYPILRFTLEFFRGDVERGKLGCLSTSQLISLAILIATLSWLVMKRKSVAGCDTSKTIHPN